MTTRTRKKNTEPWMSAENYSFPDKTLEAVRRANGKSDKEWLQEGLPRLLDRIIESYEEQGWIEHIEGRDLPSKESVIKILEDFFAVIFPGYYYGGTLTKSNTRQYIEEKLQSIHSSLLIEVEKSLKYLCRRVLQCPEDFCRSRAETVVTEILEEIPNIRAVLKGDVQAAYDGDPAARSTDEVILSYPATYAITTYRIAHELYLREVPFIPRIMTEYAHSTTGIDIHPGAKIGRNFFIDHGTGVVIGETTEIGDNVRIYQSVTLGAMSFPKDERGKLVRGVKRHPTVRDNVIIYSGTTILGGKTEIGKDAIIGGNVWITSSIPSGMQVLIAPPQQVYRTRRPKTENWLGHGI